jgi:PKD repeat protein
MADYTLGIGDELQFHSDDNALGHLWDFGDGITSTEVSPVHAYQDYGVYQVTHMAESFCGVCNQAAVHTIEIVPASLTVKSVLLDKYQASVGDTVKVTILVRNTGTVYGTGTISLKFNEEVVATHNVTLDVGDEGSYTIDSQLTSSGLINVCADNVCTVMFVLSSILVESVILSNNMTSGDPIVSTINMRNTGLLPDQRTIKTTLSNGTILTLDERDISLESGEPQAFDVPIDARYLSPGFYAVCSDNVCKSFYAATPTPKIGDLNITSTPDGARIYIDDLDQLSITPSTLRDIPVGSRRFALKLEGYNDTAGTVQIIGGITTYVYATLIPLSPTTGAIDVSSTPAGAELFINDADQNVKTPVTITDLTEGSYTIKLTLTGYQEWAVAVKIKAGQTIYLSAGLISLAVPPSIAGKYLTGGLLLIPLGLVLTRKKEKTPEELAAEARRAVVAFREINTLPLCEKIDHRSYCTTEYREVKALPKAGVRK